jgi:hypothetical protein
MFTGVNICKYSLECEICINFCKYLLLNEYVVVNIYQYEKILSEYSLRSENSLQHVFFASNRIFVCKSVRIF